MTISATTMPSPPERDELLYFNAKRHDKHFFFEGGEIAAFIFRFSFCIVAEGHAILSSPVRNEPTGNTEKEDS